MGRFFSVANPDKLDDAKLGLAMLARARAGTCPACGKQPWNPACELCSKLPDGGGKVVHDALADAADMVKEADARADQARTFAFNEQARANKLQEHLSAAPQSIHCPDPACGAWLGQRHADKCTIMNPPESE